MNKSSKIYTSSFKGFSKHIRKNIIKNSSRFIFLDYWIINNSKNLTTIKVKHKKRAIGVTNYNIRELFTLWSKMFFIVEVKKASLRSFIIILFRFLFRTFLEDMLNWKII